MCYTSDVVLWLAIAAGVGPTVILFAEVLASLVAGRRDAPVERSDRPRPSVDVLMPAHDEEAVIATALSSIQAQLAPGDRLTVIADNCTDDTARVAERLGANVVRRHDTKRRGKGFALEYGISETEASGCDVVVIVDADCLLGEGCLDRLATTCAASRRPVQALYRMTGSTDASPNMAIHQFAWDLKNRIRPLGLRQLGGPCQLMGTGMAFPRRVFEEVKVGSANIVEDLQLGLDLCKAGHPPLFCPEAIVESAFPPSASGLRQQHDRWQRGSVTTLFADGLPCFYAAIRRRDRKMLFLALDLGVPPIVMLAAYSIAVTLCAAAYGLAMADPAPFSVATMSITLLVATLALAWRISVVRASGAASRIVPFVVVRLLSYPHALMSKTASVWVRSERPNGPRVP